MDITPKLGEALITLLEAPDNQLTRCAGGFKDPQAHHYPEGRQTVVTRRTANTLVNAMLADFNNPVIPSAIKLTPRGFSLALDHACASLTKAAA